MSDVITEYRRFLKTTGERTLREVVITLLKHDRADLLVFEGQFEPVLSSYAEFKVPLGSVDLVTFHADGVMGVIEMKDGSRGLQSVLAGIGQVLGYAVQVGMAKGAVKQIKPVLLFSKTWSEAHDAVVMEACERAGVIPIRFGRPTDYQRIGTDFASIVKSAKAFIEKHDGAKE